MPIDTTDDTDPYAALIRLHIPHHTVEKWRVYGLWMIERSAVMANA